MLIAILYAFALAMLVVYSINMLWMALYYLRSGPPKLEVTEEPPLQALPPVTVQIPLYNEQFVARRVIDACAKLAYPVDLLEIQVLDDSTDETASIAADRIAHWRRRGVRISHHRRLHREGYKAGALQAGLEHASGTLIAVFDADFVPPPHFLAHLVHYFDQENVGMVQARWDHLNPESSLLTRVQACSLDAHFVVEQYVRNLAGCFINFNGTAGMWRRACIDDAGGWRSDTLTEDLDLSYRAQLAGWRFIYAPEVSAPAELPVDVRGFRQQQYRWAKGTIETAARLMLPLWRARQPLRVKVQGTVHLTAHLVFPFVLVLCVLHMPLLVLEHVGAGPGEAFFHLLAAGLVALTGVFMTHLLAQRALHGDWGRRLISFPWFLAGGIGFSLNNTRGVLDALIGRRTAFMRTPKFNTDAAGVWRSRRYLAQRAPGIAWAEGLMLLYALAGLGVTLALGRWSALPFQFVFTAGFAFITFYNVQRQVHITRVRRRFGNEVQVAAA